MCSLTTQGGIKWQLMTINGRTGYMRDSLTIAWFEHLQAYAIVDGSLQHVFRGTLQECLESVRYNVN